MIAAFDGGIRSAVFRSDGSTAAGAENPQVAEAMAGLAAYDKANEALLAGEAKGLAKFHVGRVAPLNKIVKAAEAAGDSKVELDHQKLIVDSLAAAYSSGAYPTAAKLLEDLTAKGGKIGSYAAFKAIEAEFTLQNPNTGNFNEVQDAWLRKLKAFVEKYPQSDEAPQALLFLASTNEMSGRETEAQKYYAQLTEQAPATEWGKKAAGALKRLDLVGKPLVLKGTDLKGQAIDAAAYRGKTLLVTFWATWALPAKRDLPDLAKLVCQVQRPRASRSSRSTSTTRRLTSTASSSRPRSPGPTSSRRAGWKAAWRPTSGSSRCRRCSWSSPDGKVGNRNLRTGVRGRDAQLDKTIR